MALVFKATIVDLEGQILLDFRLSRGDGIEFKKWSVLSFVSFFFLKTLH